MLRFFISIFVWMYTVIAVAAPNVVVSITPLYHITAAVMQNIGTPTLLIPPQVSEHTYALKPSQYLALNNADLVLWIGEDLETSLTKILAQIPEGKKVTLLEEIFLNRYPLREGGSFGEYSHGDHHSHQMKTHVDPHLWLDPINAISIAQMIKRRLISIDPIHENEYEKNTAEFIEAISDLNMTLIKKLKPIEQKPFIVFHDAFQYLEKRYDLKAIGSISINSHIPISAQRLVEIKALLKSENVHCIFSEPQFQASTLMQIAKDSHVRTGVLDPLGTVEPIGTEGYRLLLNRLADALTDCLS